MYKNQQLARYSTSRKPTCIQVRHKVVFYPKPYTAVMTLTDTDTIVKRCSPLSSETTAGLYVPYVVFDRCQVELLGDFGCRHTPFDVLLVGKD